MRTIQGCKVAVIGGAGFLGATLTDHLIADRDCDVLVIDNLSVGQRKYVPPGARFVWCDVCGPEEHLITLLRDHHVRFVFMTAAIPFVPDGFLKPLHTFNVTAGAVLRVLEVAAKAEVEGTAVISSAEIFGGETSGRVSETTPIQPRSTYAVAKQAADSLVQVRWREAGVKSLAIRQFNSYGPRCLQPLVLTTIIDQLSCGPTVKLGNNTTRDFQYCTDTVSVWVEILEKGNWGDVVNCGSETCIRVFDLAKMVGKLMGYDAIDIVVDPSRVRPDKVEVWHLQADCAKLHALIGYRERVSLEEGVLRTIEWYRQNGGWDFQRNEAIAHGTIPAA